MNMSLSRQLLLVSVIAVAVLALAIAITAIRIGSLRQQVVLLEGSQQSVTLLLAIKATALSVSRADPIMPETKPQLEQANQRIESDAGLLLRTLDAKSRKDIDTQVLPQWRDYLKQFQSALTIAETSPQDALSIPEQIFRLNLEPAVRALDQLVAHQEKAAGTLKLAIDKQMSRIVIEVILILLMAAATVVISQLLFARRLHRQVRHTADVAARLAQGQLTLRLPETRDELGQVSQAINSFIDQLNALLGEVKHASHQVSDQAAQLGNTADTVRDNTYLQSEDVAKIGAAMEQMSTAIDSVSAFAQDASIKSSESVALVTSVAGKTHEATAEIHALACDIDQTSGMLGELNRSVNEVTQVSELIKAIAGQTNLLALNAAIEAARAGEAGRGFAVVADEVRSLAERTSDATASINRQLAQLAARMESTREAMQQARIKAQAGAVQIESVAVLSADVAHAVQEVEALMRSIADTTVQQSQGAAEIAHEVTAINRLAEMNVVAIDRTRTDIRTLSITAKALDQAAGQFTTRT
ncbi:methyl-accepting chemotaxis protein [Chitinimonas sp. BJYL2]|uniref:methyl-accepting chemotaxis protein n=1 Tax=Chitinimonas sp. BJYL2 TaxID=2976696 RepID=UPI0022B55E1E|nr:methyl-accepting chemotaxis protein [Chitinimonas sp. BJYL2]